jgi:hypothetical protein
VCRIHDLQIGQACTLVFKANLQFTIINLDWLLCLSRHNYSPHHPIINDISRLARVLALLSFCVVDAKEKYSHLEPNYTKIIDKIQSFVFFKENPLSTKKPT